MKILSINIKNLASLEGEHKIDFTTKPLSSSGIFAITGPTGAGKSTILDALCLALFSKTPRHLNAKEQGIELHDVAGSKINQSDTRGILRKGCPEGYAEVSFAGIDGNHYKATWSVKRARNKVDGNLQAETVELTNLNSNTKYPEKKTETLKEIERLVGLNFEQFTRSVLLAQGDFTAFLKADKDQKSSLLEKLTGTDIYSGISKQVFENFRSAEQDYKDLQRKMEGIVLLTEEDLKQMADDKEIKSKRLKELTDSQRSVLAEINWHDSFLNFTKNKEDAVAALNDAGENKKAASQRITHLSLVENVQGAKSFYQSRFEIVHHLGEKNNELNEVAKKFIHLSENQKEESISLKEAEGELQLAEKDWQEAVPLLTEAKRLDVLIKEKTGQLTSALEEKQLAIKNQQEQEAKIKDTEEDLKQAQLQLIEIDKWRTENASRKPIAENFPVIKTRLEEAGKIVARKHNLAAGKEDAVKKINETEVMLAGIKNGIEEKEAQLQQIMATLSENLEAISLIPINEIQSGETETAASIEKIIMAQKAWQPLFDTRMILSALTKKVNQCNEEINSRRKELNDLKDLLAESRIKKQQAEKMLQQALLQTAAGVETLRSQLIETEPCPVCGSIDHPFAETHPQVHQLLATLKAEAERCSGEFQQLSNRCSGLDQLCQKLEKDILLFEKDKEEKEKQESGLAQKWEVLHMDQKSLPAEETSAWLEMEEANLRATLKQIQSQRLLYNQLKETNERLKDGLLNREKELDLQKNNLKDAERVHKNYSEEVVRLDKEMTAVQESLDEIIKMISSYFTNPGWFQNWENDPAGFVNKTQSFANLWQEKNSLFDSFTSNAEILKAKLKELQNQMSTLTVAVSIAEAKLTNCKELLDEIQQQRNQLFNGIATDEIEQELTGKLSAASEKQKQCKNRKDRIDDDMLKTGSTKAQLEKEIASSKAKEEALNSQINSWILQYNEANQAALDDEKVGRLLTYTIEWIKEERGQLQQIEDAFKEAETRLSDRALQLENHLQKKPSDLSFEELKIQQKELEETIIRVQKENNEIDFRLMQNTANRKQVGVLEEEKNKKFITFEKWHKLNDLIGSADGKKFRQIAQEYTLDILLGFANKHLEFLANRYQLSRVSNSLALQVMDKDMGDEIRSVHSLSGGESFLVSLALALGLASLSSSKMKVESLFIDEGFGSLDPATLNIAMDALERLHNQGRKVGVISHVQEMTERIATQIKVSKLFNGKSTIDIIG